MKKYNILILLILSVFLPSCENEELRDNLSDKKLVSVNFNLNVQRQEIFGEKIKAPQIDESKEKEISNIWVLQFKGIGNEAELIFYQYHNTFPLTDFYLYALSTETKIVILANTNDPNLDLSRIKTYSDFTQFRRQITKEEDLYNKGIMMCGTTNVNVSDTQENTFHVDLNYCLAKIELNLSVVEGSILQINKIEIGNVSSYINYAEGLFEKPLSNAFKPISFETSADFTSSKEVLFQWYVPCNMQGENSSNEAKDKNIDAPLDATYIRIFAKENDKDVVFRIYPGANEYNNFNIQHGNKYKIKLALKTAINVEYDSRIEKQD